MQNQDIDKFFILLSKKLSKPVRVILVGGAASLLLGGTRPTHDIDFAIDGKNTHHEIEEGIKEAEKKTGIVSEYSEDIERWSMLTLLDYKKHTRFYKKFGRVTIEILEPEYWSIGKMGRYLDSDVQDMIVVFKKQKTNLASLLKVWKTSMKKSPLSDELFHFKKHIEHFLKTYGLEVWGRQFDLQKSLKNI